MGFIFFIPLFFSCATNTNVIYNGENRYFEKSSNYSICPPASWQVGEFPGFKNKILIGQADNEITPSINFVEEKYDAQPKEYVDLSIGVLEKIYSDIKLLQRKDFITAKNVKGEKIVYTISQYGRFLRITQYILPGKNGTYMIITCGASGLIGDKYDDLFDKTVRTFEWSK